jgi:hypothetical protein
MADAITWRRWRFRSTCALHAFRERARLPVTQWNTDLQAPVRTDCSHTGTKTICARKLTCMTSDNGAGKREHNHSHVRCSPALRLTGTA